jgi:glucose-6-phosphate 1-dehydrogenase
VLDGLRADQGGATPIHLSAERDEVGGLPQTPYEVLLHAALIGDASRFTRQDSVEESWRIVAPLLKRPGTVHRYAPGTWGPPQAQQLVHGLGRWFAPWVGT